MSRTWKCMLRRMYTTRNTLPTQVSSVGEGRGSSAVIHTSPTRQTDRQARDITGRLTDTKAVWLAGLGPTGPTRSAYE